MNERDTAELLRLLGLLQRAALAADQVRPAIARELQNTVSILARWADKE